MRRGFLIGMALVIASGAVVASAQMQPAQRPGTVQVNPPTAPPPAPRPASERLGGVDELRYIAGALQLDEQQKQHVEGLLDEYRNQTEGADGMANLTLLRDLMQQLDKARREGDQEQVAALRKQIEDAMPARRARTQFLDGLRQTLNESQTTRLERVLAWLEKNPSGKLRPLDVFEIANGLKLSPDQQQQLTTLHRDFRVNRVAAERALGTIPNTPIATDFADAVRKILTPELQTEFDKQIAALVPAQDATPKPATEVAPPPKE